MRIGMICLPLVCVLVFSPLAQSQDQEAVKKEIKKFQGKWKCVEITVNAASLDVNLVSKTFNIIKGKEFTIKLGDQEIEGKFTIDPTKMPFEFDTTYVTPDGQTTKAEGIYDWMDGRRRVCMALPGYMRPSEFRKDKGYIYLEWEKAE
jgi:uncharacterized protein (TIGR03067 family)